MPLANYTPKIDDRRYDDIVAEIRTRIPRYTPEWTDLNDSDPGMTLVQLFAWMTDMLIYRLGRVPDLNYIKFLELIGIELQAARPAQGQVSFPVLSSHPHPYVIVPSRTRVSAEDPDGPAPIIFETDRSLIALTAKLNSVMAYDGYSYKNVTPFNETGDDEFDPFGPVAPRESAMLMGFDYRGDFPQAEVNIYIAVAESRVTGGIAGNRLGAMSAAPAKLVWEYWNGSTWRPLNLLKDETLAFTRSGHVYLMAPPKISMKKGVFGDVNEEQYWIRARVETTSYERPPRLLAVRTNTVSVTQAQTVRNEVLGGSDGRPDQIFRLANAPVLEKTLHLEVNEGDGFSRWTEVEDFFGSGDKDRHFILDRTTGEVRFGNGRSGAIPVGNNSLPTSNIVAREYRFGGGARGNVPAGAIRTLVTSVPGVDQAKVSNLQAAVAGQEEETLEEARLRAPRAIRSRGRAVTTEDFEQLAIESANVKRARALPLAHPDFPGIQVPGAVTVIVVPDGTAPNPVPSEGTLRAVTEHLNRVRLLTTELYVVPPTYQKVSVAAEIIAEDSADIAEVKMTIERALLDYFHPLKGGDAGSGWPFGGDIYFSKIYGKATVDGVSRIEKLTVSIDGKPVPECTNIPVCDGVLIYSTEHDVSVNYDHDYD